VALGRGDRFEVPFRHLEVRPSRCGQTIEDKSLHSAELIASDWCVAVGGPFTDNGLRTRVVAKGEIVSSRRGLLLEDRRDSFVSRLGLQRPHIANLLGPRAFVIIILPLLSKDLQENALFIEQRELTER
jgi:hypothetical protein